MNDTVVIAGDLNLQNIIDGDILPEKIIDGQPFTYYQGSGGTREHDKLTHREFEDQHPISAITQLMQELSARPAETLSNVDIQNILNH